MKKLLLPVAVMAAFAFTSCGGINVEEAANEFCACKDKDDKNKCLDEWAEKYKDKKGSDSDGEELAKKMMECDTEGLMYIAPKLK